MEKVLIAVAGPDRAGVVYSVAEAVLKLDCDFVDMSQTTVANQFSSIMIIEKPKKLTKEDVKKAVQKIFEKRGFEMSVVVRDVEPGEAKKVEGEPFVMTLDGHNHKGVLTAFTRIFFDSGINIDNFRSIDQHAIDDKSTKQKVLLVFEITIPAEVDRKALTRTLADIAKEHEMSMSLQHRQIFEAVHRVSVA